MPGNSHPSALARWNKQSSCGGETLRSRPSKKYGECLPCIPNLIAGTTLWSKKKRKRRSENKFVAKQVVRIERQLLYRVLNHRVHRSKIDYLVHYRGTDDTETRWAHTPNLMESAPAALIDQDISQHQQCQAWRRLSTFAISVTTVS